MKTREKIKIPGEKEIIIYLLGKQLHDQSFIIMKKLQVQKKKLVLFLLMEREGRGIE